MAREGDRDRHARSVFVGNIPFEATETELREIFEQAGPIVSFRIVHDRETGKPKGFGFIEYQDTAIAASCCRNLNNVEYNGRPLRVGPASTDGGAAANSEIKALQQALGNAVQESPYGQAVEPAEAPEAISKAVSSLPPEQMFELMKQMKICIQNNPNEARNMLLQNPQLAYALLQAQIVMKIVDPAVAMALLHRERETQPPIRSEAPPAEPVRPPVAPNPLVSPTGVRPLVAGGLLGDGPPKSAPAGDPRLQQAPPQTQSWPENRAAAPSNIAGPPPDAWSAPTKPPGFDRDQRGGPPPRSGDYDRGSQSWDRRDSREQNDSRSRSDPRDRDPRERGEPRDRSNPRDVRNDPRDRMDPRDRRGAPPHGGFSDRERDRGAPPSRHVPPARNEPPPRSEPPPHISRSGPPSQQQYPPRAPPAQAASPAIPAALAGADSEKAALIMQVLQLTDEQIQQLPPEQRQSIILLKQQLQQR